MMLRVASAVEGPVHANHFDRLVREWSTAGTRRGLLRVLMGAPLIGLLAAGGAAETGAGHRRRARHRARGDKNRALLMD